MTRLHNVSIIDCNFNDALHLEALVDLLNEYILDDIEGGKKIDGFNKLYLVDGLNNHPAKYIYFAEYNSELIGLAVCFEQFSTFTQKPIINIHDLIVKKEFRQKGVATMILKKIEEKATEIKCSKITLEVRYDNTPAQIVYIEQGFKPCNPNMLFWQKVLL